MNQLLAMRAFVRVVDTSSFSQAAGHMGLPRSTVSKLITDLEKHLGITLMVRTTRTVTTTAEGLEYYHHALRLLGELDEVDNAVRGKTLKPNGHLRIDAPASFANCLLIPALPSFHAEYPDVSVSIGISDRTVNIVGEGVDCAFRAGELQDMAMVARKVVELKYVTCASPAYLKARGTPMKPADLESGHLHAGYFFAATGKSEPMVFEQDGERHEVDTGMFSTNEGNGLTALMVAGLGVGQHLRRFVQPYLDSGDLVEVLPEWTRPALYLHAVYPQNRHQNARLKVFVEWALRTFGYSA